MTSENSTPASSVDTSGVATEKPPAILVYGAFASGFVGGMSRPSCRPLATRF